MLVIATEYRAPTSIWWFEPPVYGSAGAIVTGTGDRIDDVAVGRYVVTVAYQEPGKPAVDLLVRVRST